MGGGLGWGWDGYRWEGGKAGMLANVSCSMSLSGSHHSYSSMMAPQIPGVSAEEPPTPKKDHRCWFMVYYLAVFWINI